MLIFGTSHLSLRSIFRDGIYESGNEARTPSIAFCHFSNGAKNLSRGFIWPLKGSNASNCLDPDHSGRAVDLDGSSQWSTNVRWLQPESSR